MSSNQSRITFNNKVGLFQKFEICEVMRVSLYEELVQLLFTYAN